MSMPSVTAGSRQRKPTPAEYSSGSPNLSNALPKSKNAATPKLRGRSREISTVPVSRCLPPTFTVRRTHTVDSCLVFAVIGRYRLLGRQLVVAEAAHAAVATGEEAHGAGQLAEFGDEARADFASQQQMPLRA